MVKYGPSFSRDNTHSVNSFESYYGFQPFDADTETQPRDLMADRFPSLDDLPGMSFLPLIYHNTITKFFR